jgi:hypothetical protein
MALINQARDWLSGTVAHSGFGLLKNGYKPAMKTLGREGVYRRKTKGEWVPDGVAYRVGKDHHDPGAPALSESASGTGRDQA